MRTIARIIRRIRAHRRLNQMEARRLSADDVSRQTSLDKIEQRWWTAWRDSPAIDLTAKVVSGHTIKIVDLQVGEPMLHVGIEFRDCSFIGPGALIIRGGSFVGVCFTCCGDVLAAQEDAYLTGIACLDDCSFFQCDFTHITLIANKTTADQFRAAGLIHRPKE